MDLEYASELFSYVDREIALNRGEVRDELYARIDKEVGDKNITDLLWENPIISRDDVKEIVIEVLMEKGIITPEDFSRLDSSKIGELYNF